MKACPPPFSSARVGKNYVAVIIGGDTEPELLVKDLTRAQVDEEADAFSGMMILDCGFYGDDGQYSWTLSMDVYGTKANTVTEHLPGGQDEHRRGVAGRRDHLQGAVRERPSAGVQYASAVYLRL